ncbi:MAG: endonuclease/exonuclease/phosphatase family protein, partial [Ramlibacter sp.]
HALRELHAQACAQAAAPPQPSDDGSPFQTKVHTGNAVLCGDFNLEAHEPEYTEVTRPFAHGQLWDSWRLLNGAKPQPPTFRAFDRTYGPEPVTCDFVFVSDGLKDRVRNWRIDSTTQFSDHQPVAVEFG